jgi:hypothetical protein
VEQGHQLDWTGEDIEGLWKVIKTNLMKLELGHVPLKKKQQHSCRPWFRGNVKRWSRKKLNAWASYKSNPSVRLLRKYKRTRNTAIKVSNLSKKKFELRLARNVSRNLKRFYGYVQSHARLRRQVAQSMKTGEGEVRGDGQIAEELRKFFLSVFRQDQGEIQTVEYDRMLSSKMQNFVITEENTREQLQLHHPSKAPGPDGMHPAMLKMAGEVLVAPLTELFNRSLNQGTIPLDWKVATVVPIHKGQEIDRVKNYRPVSLTSVPSKVFERILRNAITEYLLDHNLFHPSQHGFIRGKSCLTNLLLALDEITDAIDRRDKIHVGYLDFEKAFDSVNHRLLLVKLRAYGIADNICAWIEEFLHERTFTVKVREAVSQPAKPTSGVPQGTVLGPLLFLIYVNDLTIPLHSTCFLFADDVKIISSLSEGSQLQQDLDKISVWSRKWDLPLNPTKCAMISNEEGGEDLYIEGKRLERPT